MAKKPRETVGEVGFWAYANLAMAHAAVEKGAKSFTTLHYQIRARLYAGLRDGRMRIGTLLDDERLKMQLPRCCAYCGSESGLTLDHLIPRSKGGPDTGDNVVWVCRSCNSSKGSRDLIDWWFANRDGLPPLMVLRRYLKLALQHAEEADQLDVRLEDLSPSEFPFSLQKIPTKFPAPSELELFRAP